MDALSTRLLLTLQKQYKSALHKNQNIHQAKSFYFDEIHSSKFKKYTKAELWNAVQLLTYDGFITMMTECGEPHLLTLTEDGIKYRLYKFDTRSQTLLTILQILSYLYSISSSIFFVVQWIIKIFS